MSSEEASIARSADASQQHETQANESPQEQQHCRTANANHHQESQANESMETQQTHRTADANHHQESQANETPQQLQTHRTANANQEQQRRNSNGSLFEAALHCNIDRTNHMECVECYTLGAMDVVCQFCGAIDLSPKRGMDKYLLENYAAMEIRLVWETY